MRVTFWLDDEAPDAIKALSLRLNEALRDCVSVATCACSDVNLELYTLNRGNKALYALQGFEQTGYYPVNASVQFPRIQLVKTIPNYAKRSSEDRERCAALMACLYGLEGQMSPKHVRSRFCVTYGRCGFGKHVAELGAFWKFKVLDLSRAEHRSTLIDISKQLRKQHGLSGKTSGSGTG